MHYIRFLKPPKIQDNKVKALVTITTDLGEYFLLADQQLLISLRSVDGTKVSSRTTSKWKEGMRSLAVSLDTRPGNTDWPARLHVAPQGSLLSDRFDQSQHQSGLPAIVSAWSDTLDPRRGVFEATKTVERRFTTFSNRKLCIWEETGESIARHIWDAGLALSAYLDQLITLQPGDLPLVEACLDTANLRKLNVIELGSGCGIVGICLVQSIPNCDVLLTDLAEAQEIAERNLASMKPARDSTAEFQQLDWDEPLPESVGGRTFAIILIADCTYNPDSGPSLVHTLGRLMKTSPNAIVLLSMKVRHQSELVFFELMTEAGFVQDICHKIPLPDVYNDSEEVLVYAFLHKGRQGDI